MELLGAISVLSFLVVGTTVGVRLLALARRTGKAPERTMGLGLLLIAGIGFPLLALSAQPELVGGMVITFFVFVPAMACLNTGIFCLYSFTRQVFRPNEAWARHAVRAAGLALAGTAVGVVVAAASSNATVPDEAVPYTRPWAVLLLLLCTTVYLWTALESSSFHAKLRRRLALGLADPVVANRFLLWSVAGFAAALLCILNLALVQSGANFSADGPTRLVGALAGLTQSVAWYLAFLPPRRYVAWIEARARAAA